MVREVVGVTKQMKRTRIGLIALLLLALLVVGCAPTKAPSVAPAPAKPAEKAPAAKPAPAAALAKKVANVTPTAGAKKTAAAKNLSKDAPDAPQPKAKAILEHMPKSPVYQE